MYAGRGARMTVAVWLGLLLVAQLGAVAERGADEPAAAAEPTTTTTTTAPTTMIAPTTVAPTSTTATTSAATTTAAATTTPPTPPTTTATTAPPPPAPARVCCDDWTMRPYLGVGAWVDVYDWTDEFAWTKGKPTVLPDQVDDMAAAGVQTLFIQTARTNGTTDLAEPDRLQQFIDAAHANGMDVVGWYLPTLTDPETDLRRMFAATTLDLDGFTVDIESKDVADEAERNRRLVDVSRRMREHVGSGVLGTVIINAFAIEQLKPEAWPHFPWAEIDPYYDVWQPMAYVSYREDGSEWRDAERYTAASIEAMRNHVGTEPIHVVTGTADDLTTEDIEGFVRASRDHGATGGGIYDWSVATPEMWAAMAPLRA